MKNCKDLIKDEKYRNWVKGTLGIEQTSKAVCEYVNGKLSLYLQGTATLNKPAIQSYLTAEEYSHFRDDLTSELRYKLKQCVKLKDRKLYVGYIGSCQKCKSTLEKILSLHKSLKDINWNNSDDSRALSPEWAIAKIFMPMGNEKTKGPGDTDPSAIFKLMKMCDLFMNPIRERNIDGAMDARNSLFHSSDNLVEHADLEQYFTHMENLICDALNDPDIGAGLKRVIDDILKKIVKLKESEMTMTLFEDAQKAMRIKRTAIYYEFEQCLCDNDPVQLKELLKLAEKLGSDLEFLNNHFDEIKSQNVRIEELEKQVNDNVCKIEQLTKLRDSQNDEITQLKNDIKEKGVEVHNLEERLKDKNDELQQNIANNNTKIRDLEDKLNKGRMENKEKQEEITEHKANIGDLEKKLNKSIVQTDTLQKEISKNGAIILKLEESVIEEQKANGDMQEEIKKHKVKIRDLEERVNKKIKENDELHDEFANSNATILDLQEKVNNRAKENCELQKEIANNNDKIRVLEDKLNQNRTERDGLREENSKKQVTIADLLQQKHNLERKIHAQKSAFTDVSKNIDAIQQQLKNLQHKNELQRCENESLEWETVAIASGLAITAVVFLGW